MIVDGSEVARKPFERVATSLKQRILAGEWRPGMLLPGRRALAAEYGVAGSTLERAITVLSGEGLISISRSRGTFVADLSDLDRPIPRAAPPPPTAPRDRKPLVAKVGIIAAGIVPYGSPEIWAGQWAAQILAGCEHGLARERGLTQRFVSLVPEMGRDIACEQAAKQLLDDGVDALVVLGCGELEATLALAEAAGVPLVCAEYDPMAVSMPQVYIDNEAGGALAARHLRERGYGPIVYLRPFGGVWTESRLAGARSALGHDAVRVFPVDTPEPLAESHTWEDQHAAGLDAGRTLLKAGIEAGTGVIAPNDSVAMGCIEAARERGLEPGRDYGIVGFDDYCREAHLTSLRPPLAQLGHEAAELVVRLLRGEDAAARVTLRHQLIARESTAAGGNGGGRRAEGILAVARGGR